MTELAFNMGLYKADCEEQIIEITLSYIRKIFQCDACAVILYDEITGNLVLKGKYTWGFSGFLPIEAHYAVGEGITGKAVETGEPQIINDIPAAVKTDSKAYVFKSFSDVNSSIAVPITKGSRIYGAITADSNTKNFFSQNDIVKLSNISGNIGSRLFHIHTKTQNDSKRDEENKIRNIRNTITQLLDEFDNLGNEDDLLEKILDILNLMAPYDVCAIFSRKKDESDITLVKSRNLKKSLTSADFYNLQKSPVKDIMEKEGSLLETDAASPQKRTEFHYLLEIFDFCSCMAVTYEASDNEKHAIFLFHQERNQYQFTHLFLMLTVSVLFSVLRQKKNLNIKIQSVNQYINIGKLLPATVHEIRNSFTGTIGIPEQLKEYFSRTDQTPSADFLVSEMDKILRAANQGKNYLNSLLDTARVQTKKFIRTEINQIVKNIISLLQFQAAEKSIRLEFMPGNPEIFSTTDPDSLRQVLINMLLNPIEILDKGKKICIMTEFDVSQPLPVIINIRDNGRGIHHEDLDKIFRPYYSTRGGTGFGLYISKKIIEAELGGSLSAESVLDVRTTFTIKLPEDSRKSI